MVGRRCQRCWQPRRSPCGRAASQVRALRRMLRCVRPRCERISWCTRPRVWPGPWRTRPRVWRGPDPVPLRLRCLRPPRLVGVPSGVSAGPGRGRVRLREGAAGCFNRSWPRRVRPREGNVVGEAHARRAALQRRARRHDRRGGVFGTGLWEDASGTSRARCWQVLTSVCFGRGITWGP